MTHVAPSSPVREFYTNKNIFLTGVTGFLGKALVEKLLRTCDVGTIYLLIRPKYGKTLQQRVEHLTSNLVFERIKAEKGNSVFSNLVPIAGDINPPDLGLSSTDKQTLIDNVDVVFHSAATLDFALGLKDVVTANLIGTRLIVDLCKEMKNVQCLVYVSSAYVNSNRTTADEVLYPQHLTGDELLALIAEHKTKPEDKVMAKALHDHPNSYTISKALAEFEVQKCNGCVPSVIIRPSMIVGAWKEPVPGWTDSKNGPQGFFTGAAMGVVRRLPMDKKLVTDYIPVDTVVNQLIVAAWHTASTRPQQTAVYHCTSSTRKPFTWDMVDTNHKINNLLHEYPVKSAVWYPTLKMVPNFTLFRISALFVHFLPAIFFDCLLKLSGGKPRLFRLHYKIDSSLCLLAPFIFKEWFFDSSNTEKLSKSLTQHDKNVFDIDIADVDYNEYFVNAILGARRYLNKEEMNTLPAARKKMRVMYYLNLAVQATVIWFMWWAVAVVLDSDLMDVIWALPVSLIIFSFL